MLNVECRSNTNSSLNIHHSTLLGLAGLRPQKLAVTIHAAPVAIDKCHRITAHGALRRRPLVDDRELWQFIIVVDHGVNLPLLARFHFEQQRLLSALPARHTDKREPPIDYGGRHRSYRMSICEASPILCRNVHLAITEAIFHPQLFPQIFR